MGQLVDELGQKSAGQLIKSAEWNALVAAVEGAQDEIGGRIDALAASLDGRLSAVTGQIDALNSIVDNAKAQFNILTDSADAQTRVINERIDAIGRQLDSLRGSLDTLSSDQFKVRLESARPRYAIGEMAEVTAHVVDSQGSTVDLSQEADPPWIDFVAVWGRFRPAEGFESKGESGEKTLSVRVNAEGIAKVWLKAEHTEGFANDAEIEVSSFLNIDWQGQGTGIAEAILRAAAPMDCGASGVFDALSQEYNRADANSFRNCVDAYYSQNLGLIKGGPTPRPIHRWRDHTSTVIAVAKMPDGAQKPSVDTVQVRFTDWITPWIVLEYLASLKDRIADVKARLASKITADYNESVRLVTDCIIDIIGSKGILGKQREYTAIRGALDALPVSSPPSFLPALVKSIRDALDVQENLDGSMSAASSNDDLRTFRLLNETLTRNDSDESYLEERLREAAHGVEAIASSISELKNTVRFMEGRLDASLSEGGELQRIRTELNSVTQQVGALQSLDAADVQDKLGELRLINARLEALESRGHENVQQEVVQESQQGSVVQGVQNDVALVADEVQSELAKEIEAQNTDDAPADEPQETGIEADDELQVAGAEQEPVQATRAVELRKNRKNKRKGSGR